jgi:hypothetical protein
LRVIDLDDIDPRIGVDRELFIRKSNSFVACVRLMAKDRGGVSLDHFDWSSLTPDWNVVEEQVLRLAPPYIEGPSLVMVMMSVNSWEHDRAASHSAYCATCY